jgi:aminoglycoside N3'-acetyltransferase
MFGVTFRYYTLFHTAEWLSGSEYACEQGEMNQLRVVDERGEARECWSKRNGRGLPRFNEAGDLLESTGLVRRLKLGRGYLLYVPDCAMVHDFLVERLRRTPDFLRQSCRMPLQ